MTIEQFTKKMIEIQNNTDVNSLKYKNIHIWPLVRLLLIDKLINKREFFIPKIDSIEIIEKKLQNYQYQTDSLLQNIKSKNIEILINLNENYQHKIEINGRYYNRFVDSFYDEYKNKNNIKILAIRNTDNQKFVHKEAKIYIDQIANHTIRMEILSAFYHKKYNFKGFKNFYKKLRKMNIGIKKNEILYFFTVLMVYKKYYTKIFKMLSPKKFVTYCYYEPRQMGAILAANKLNIKTIELQHGYEHPYHYMNSYWTSIPKSGYKMLPKEFWVWEKEDAKKILFWSKKSIYHTAKIKGNTFLKHVKKIYDNYKDIAIEKAYPKNKFHILITLQLEKWLDQKMIIDIINSFKDNTFIMWHFKPHPIFDINLFEEKLKPYIINKNIEINTTKKKNIYQIAKYVDMHITYSSTVAYELKQLEKIRTIFLNEYMKNSTKYFIISNKKKEIVDILKNSAKSKFYKRKF